MSGKFLQKELNSQTATTGEKQCGKRYVDFNATFKLVSKTHRFPQEAQ
jgi:hypothetical protein